MASVSLTLQHPTSGRDATVTSKNFSADELDAFLTANKTQFVGLLTPFFPTLATGDRLAQLPASTTVRSTRTTARIIEGTNANPTSTKAVRAVTAALAAIDQSPTLRFPNDELDVYLVESSDLSLGYLYIEARERRAAIALGRTAVNAAGNAMNYTVAQEVFKYYEPTFTVNGLEKRIMTTAIHEMGHVFHQMNSLESYITLARCAELGSVIRETTESKFEMFAAKLADFNPRPSVDDMHLFVKTSSVLASDVSNYAYANGLNEFVAEVFSALVVGSPLGSDNDAPTAFSGTTDFERTLAAYRALGGPVPEQAVCHVRTGQGKLKKALYSLMGR